MNDCWRCLDTKSVIVTTVVEPFFSPRLRLVENLKLPILLIFVEWLESIAWRQNGLLSGLPLKILEVELRFCEAIPISEAFVHFWSV